MMLLALSAGRGVAQQAAHQSAAAGGASNPISGMEWLVGGVWIAAGEQLGPHMKHIETR